MLISLMFFVILFVCFVCVVLQHDMENKKEINIIFLAPSQAPSRRHTIFISSYTEGWKL